MAKKAPPAGSAPKPAAEVHRKFGDALDALIARIRQDRSVIAAILCGSLSHDRVWEKSDIDLVLVTVDERKGIREGLALYADGINVHAFFMTRTAFRQTLEGAFRNSFFHSFLAKGRLLYAHDETIERLCSALTDIGERDNRLQLLAAGCAALPCVYKARKWFLTRGDLDYTALWILYAAQELARVEVVGARQLAAREVIPDAMKLNPAFFRIVYTDLLNTKKTEKNVEAALAAIDEYLARRAPSMFGAVIDHLREAGEARTSSEIEDHFQRNFGIGGVTGVCEYLADRGLLGKAHLPVRLTPKSNVQVDELAFFHSNEEDHDR